SVPGQGLFRTFLPSLVWPFHFGSIDARFWNAFENMKLPRWLFAVEDIRSGRNSDVVIDFYSRSPDGSVPWRRWIAPIAVWGIFVAAMWSALLGLMAIVRHQWAQNERLPFPLARVQALLIEAPEAGRALNRLFSSAMFWVALAAVCLLQSVAALHRYFPTSVPEVP